MVHFGSGWLNTARACVGGRWERKQVGCDQVARPNMAYAMLLTCALVGLGAHASAPVEVRDSADRVTLTNGFVSVSFNKRSPSIDDIRGDFVGGGAYGPNVASSGFDQQRRGGIVLERFEMEPNQDIWPIPHASSACANPTLNVSAAGTSASRAVVRIDGVLDDCLAPAVTSTWTISLDASARSFALSVSARVLRRTDVAAVSVSAYLSDPQTIALMDDGTMAQQYSTWPYFAPSRPLRRLYSLGRRSSLDMTNFGPPATPEPQAGAAARPTAPPVSRPAFLPVVLNANDDQWFRSGAQLLLCGSFPATDAWTNNWQFPTRHTISLGQTFGVSFDAWPNNRPFPTSTVPSAPFPFPHAPARRSAVGAGAASGGGAATSGPPEATGESSWRAARSTSPASASAAAADADGVQAMLMGSYAAAAGCLYSYLSTHTLQSGVALIADEQTHPRRSNYKGLFNFYDPSGYFHISTLVSSGEPLLVAEARRLLDTVSAAQLKSGALPHHFIEAKPVFTAISGATLPATNLFWVKAALR